MFYMQIRYKTMVFEPLVRCVRERKMHQQLIQNESQIYLEIEEKS